MEINNANDLDEAIIALQKKKVEQQNELIEQFDRMKKSVNPVNLVRSSISTVTHTPELKSSTIKTALGIGLGLLTKNMFLGKATPIIKNLVSNAVEKGVENGISDTTLYLKSYGKAIYDNLFKRKSKSKVKT